MNAIDGYATDEAMRQVDDGTAGQKFDASARTWHRIGTEQTRLGTRYAQAVNPGTGGWTGRAGDASISQAAALLVTRLAARIGVHAAWRDAGLSGA